MSAGPASSRRGFLKTVAAAGVAAGAPAWRAIAQEKASGQVLAETLARYAANLKYEDIPEDVVRLAKRTILDTIGCAYRRLCGRPQQDRDQARRATSARSSPQPC